MTHFSHRNDIYVEGHVVANEGPDICADCLLPPDDCTCEARCPVCRAYPGDCDCETTLEA